MTALCIELRLAEQMYHRIVAAGVREHEARFGGLEMAHLAGLVAVDSQPVALGLAHLVDVASPAQDAASSARFILNCRSKP